MMSKHKVYKANLSSTCHLVSFPNHDLKSLVFVPTDIKKQGWWPGISVMDEVVVYHLKALEKLGGVLVCASGNWAQNVGTSPSKL